MYIKAGTIIPLLNLNGADNKCLSLTDCYSNTITLQIYLSKTQRSKGLLYIDDGITYDMIGSLY